LKENPPRNFSPAPNDERELSIFSSLTRFQAFLQVKLDNIPFGKTVAYSVHMIYAGVSSQKSSPLKPSEAAAISVREKNSSSE
jgi:hypothetical protein